jgi:UDP-N-acetylglucosamine 2-epimerase (non-hydrolysing)
VLHPRAHLLPPLDYLDETLVLERCRFIMTDSGGIQEEAAALGKPVLVLRKATERPEGPRAGVSRLAGVEPGKIVALASRLIRDQAFYRSMARPVDVFGDGRAAGRIAREIERHLGLARSRPANFSPARP